MSRICICDLHICVMPLCFADLDRSLPQMPFPGRRVLADSCLGTLLSLWVSLLLFSESFSILQYPVWEGERRGQTVNVAVWWQVALASSLPPHCLGVTLSDACLWTEPWEHPWCLLCCENEFLVLISASITLAYANVRALVWNAVIVSLIHDIPFKNCAHSSLAPLIPWFSDADWAQEAIGDTTQECAQKHLAQMQNICIVHRQNWRWVLTLHRR